jgi:predicted RNA-binding Zn ribbon-like protein
LEVTALETQVFSGKFLFWGNQPSLDFVNTEVVMDGGQRSLIMTFDDLLDWLVAANLLDAAMAADARTHWDATDEGREVLTQALAFRAALRQMAGEIVENKPVADSTLRAINQLLRLRQGYDQVIAEHGQYRKQFHFTPTQPAHLLIPIAESAGDLLCTAEFSLVKRCENPECILYFYDTTKNHARRWCSMAGCGNRHKQAAHYDRTRKQSRRAQNSP